MKSKLRIFDCCWHVPHQWDMIQALRNDCDFYCCANIKTGWDTSRRPVPGELNFVAHYEAGQYDAAILHVDQQSIDPLNKKRMIYEQFNSVISDIPKIVINHGSPVFPEYFHSLGLSLSDDEMQQRCISSIRELVGNNTMVVNSRTAATEKEWGFGYPVIHAMNHAEWHDLPKEPRAFTALSPAGFDTYYNRKCMGEVSDVLYDRYGYILHYAGLNVDTGNTPESYRQYLGKSMLYVDTSFRTPMNRARTEAFLSGCCVIQVEGAHDLEYWAKPGENIITVPDDPEEIARVIAGFLHEGYQQAIAIGKRGKEMAKSEFNYVRYRNDWMGLLEKTVSSYVASKPKTKMKSSGKTGIVPWTYSYDIERSVGSTYLRVTQLTKNYPDFEQFVHGKKYDSLIFQQFCWEEMMQRFPGPKILDICDPNWIQYNLDIVKTGSFVHALTCSSKELTQLVKSFFPDKIVEHVPDRLDLSTFPLPRAKHRGKARKAVWFGYTHNAYETLPQLVPSIRENGLQLRIIANLPCSEKDGIAELNPEFLYYDHSTVYEQIREADILLNPRSDRAFFRYKSNNKSLVGWQLGLPVAVTGGDVMRLMNPDERNREVSDMQPFVKQEYLIEKSAEQYHDIIRRIRQRYFS